MFFKSAMFNVLTVITAAHKLPHANDNNNYYCPVPGSITMALGLTQPLTEMSTKNISWGVKAAGS